MRGTLPSNRLHQPNYESDTSTSSSSQMTSQSSFASELRRQRLAAMICRQTPVPPQLPSKPVFGCRRGNTRVDLLDSRLFRSFGSRSDCGVSSAESVGSIDSFYTANDSFTDLSVKRSKRFRSMSLSLVAFMVFTTVLCFIDGIWKPSIYPNFMHRAFHSHRRISVQADDDAEQLLSWFQETISHSSYTPDQQRRALAILKTRWPECMENELTSQQCKELIDADIEGMFTGVDQNVTSHIIKVRSIQDDNYNWVVIQTSSAIGGLVRGPFGDGIVYYHFDWNSTGEEATIEQQKDIPSVNGYIVDGMNVNASTIDEYIAGNATGSFIAGGWYKPYYVNTDWAQPRLDLYLSTEKTIETSQGLRSLGPWNCAGLTGESCCAIIKHDVRESDTRDSAIQCWIDELGGQPNGPLTRKTCEDDITKVCVYERYDGNVLRVPILAYDRVIDEAMKGGYNITPSEEDDTVNYAVPSPPIEVR